MLPLQITGHAGCGKTTLIVELIKALTKKGMSVGTMKHSTHIHELDKPGKDSFRHREAGAAPVAMVTELMSAVYLPKNENTDPKKILDTYYSDVDIVLIEGWISGPYQKIEVWRKTIGPSPLFKTIKNVKAIVSDDSIKETDLPVFPRSDIKPLVDFILIQTVKNADFQVEFLSKLIK
jgi:molybdopterin-guanine dinucleotide biosynthesis protein B